MLLALVLILGCTDDTTDTADSGATGGDTVTVSGLAMSFGTGNPVESGTACIDALAEPCVDIGSDGTYTFEAVPVGTSSIFRLESEGHRSALSGMVVGQEDLDVWGGLVPQASWSVALSLSKVTEDPSKGHVAMWAVPEAQLPTEGDMPGFAMTLSDSSAEGPIYTDDEELPDLEATTTGNMGFAAFFNATPGTWEGTVSQDGWTCVPHPWLNSSTSGGAIEVPVEAGWNTYVLAVCTED